MALNVNKNKSIMVRKLCEKRVKGRSDTQKYEQKSL